MPPVVPCSSCFPAFQCVHQLVPDLDQTSGWAWILSQALEGKPPHSNANDTRRAIIISVVCEIALYVARLQNVAERKFSAHG